MFFGGCDLQFRVSCLELVQDPKKGVYMIGAMSGLGQDAINEHRGFGNLDFDYHSCES